MSKIERLGAHARATVTELCLVIAILWGSLGAAVRKNTWRRTVRQVLVRQIYFTGVQALPIVSGIALLVGPSIVLQSGVWFRDAGQSSWIGPFLVAVLFREIAPFAVNMVMLLRSGGAIATELGSMMVAGEVRLLDGQGIDPFHYLVVPRIIGMAISAVALTVVFLVIAFTSGYSCSVAIGVQPAGPWAFANSVLRSVDASDLVILTGKILIPALLTGVICCREGLSIDPVRTEVPKAVMRALARSGSALFVSSLILSILRYA